jgi:MoaA/NifB/PqqE/SkfB family radical SAM enzyme
MANAPGIKKLQQLLPRLYSLIPFYFFQKYAFPPMHAYFEVTYRCNLRCDMCHFLEIIEDTETNKKYTRELSGEAIKKAITSLPWFTVVTFTGGEVFMKSDFPEILRFAAGRNKVHLITNGTTLTSHTVDSLLDLRLRSVFGSGLFFIGVSLEGSEELHDKITAVPGSFRKTTQGLELLIKKRRDLNASYPLTHLTCVISKTNVHELSELYGYANKIGVDVCNFVLKNPATYWHAKDYDQVAHLRQPQPPTEEISEDILRAQLSQLAEQSKTYQTQLRFSPNGITDDEIVRYYANKSTYKDYRCYAAWSKVGVSAYGDVFSCPYYRSANLQEKDGMIPWNVQGYAEFRELLKKEKIFPGCLGCCQSEYIG